VVDVGRKPIPVETTSAANVSMPPNEPPTQSADSSPNCKEDSLDSSQRSHDLSQSQASPHLQNSDAVCPSFTETNSVETEQSRLETAVLNIMCQHMPSDPSSPMGPYIQGFMTIRLIILKDSNQRTDQDNMLLGTILGSYSAYVSARRASEDISLLLARDCMFLRQLS
jgi:hypothetical protein